MQQLNRQRRPSSLRPGLALVLSAGTCFAMAARAQEPQDTAAPDAAAARAPVLVAVPAAHRDLSVVVGTKLWINRWSSWSLRAVPTNQATRQVIEPVSSNTRVSVIPQFSVRYRDFVASTSFMTTTNYTLDQQWQPFSRGSRSEADANLGYYLAPGLAATVGVKRMRQDFSGRFTWAGPMVGLSATASLTPNLSSYFGIGAGSMKARLGSPDGAGNTSLHSQYVLSEAGLAYPMGNLGLRVLRSGALTVGYRSQTLTTKGYVLNDTNTPASRTQQNVRDSTQGFTVGLVAAF